MDNGKLNKETIVKLMGLLPAEQVVAAINVMEQSAIKKEQEAEEKLIEAKQIRLDVAELKDALASLNFINSAVELIKAFTEPEKQPETSDKKSFRGTFTGGTFKNRIISLFNNGVPLTARELYDLHNTNFGVMKDKSFTSQLSNLVTQSKVLKFSSVNLIDSGSQNYYGLTHWFDEVGELKITYVEKIKSAQLRIA